MLLVGRPIVAAAASQAGQALCGCPALSWYIVRYILMKELWQFPMPWLGPRARFFEMGEVRLAVLSLLRDNPTHGYDLMKQLAARLGTLYQASAGTVYPALQQLEKEGLVVYKTESGRKIYRLTAAGRKLLASEAATVRGIWERAESMEDLGQQMGPHCVAVAGPVSELLTAALQASRWSAGNPDREDRVRAILRRTAAELNRLSQGVRS